MTERVVLNPSCGSFHNWATGQIRANSFCRAGASIFALRTGPTIAFSVTAVSFSSLSNGQMVSIHEVDFWASLTST